MRLGKEPALRAWHPMSDVAVVATAEAEAGEVALVAGFEAEDVASVARAASPDVNSV